MGNRNTVIPQLFCSPWEVKALSYEANTHVQESKNLFLSVLSDLPQNCCSK